MGKPLMLREEDVERIDALRRKLAIDRKVDVVRAGIELLEKEAQRRERIAGWKRATRLAVASSREVNADFRRHSRMKKI